MEDSRLDTRLPKRSKGLFATGVALVSLGALILVFLIVLLSLDPTLATVIVIVSSAFLIWLGVFYIEHSKSGYIAQLGKGVKFSGQKLVGIVSVDELVGVGWGTGSTKRDLRFFSSGILSPAPQLVQVESGLRPFGGKSYAIPYADISKIRVYKALGFIPRIEIRTRFGSRNRFTITGRKTGLREARRAFLNSCSIISKACPDKLQTKPKYLKDALALELHKAETDLESLTGKTALFQQTGAIPFWIERAHPSQGRLSYLP